MSDHIKLTDAGLRYLEMETLGRHLKKGHPNGFKPNTSQSQILPTLNKQQNGQETHRGKLLALSKQLNKLYTKESRNLDKQNQKVQKKTIRKLKYQMLKDLGTVNKFSDKKAHQFAQRLFRKIDSKLANPVTLNRTLSQTQLFDRVPTKGPTMKIDLQKIIDMKNSAIKESGQEENLVSLEVSKNRNYLARINNLHQLKTEKYKQICENIRKDGQRNHQNDQTSQVKQQ